MADPQIRLKRSAVSGKIPTANQLPLGEIALNTYDGKVFASKNVGVGTTVFAVNPWDAGEGGATYDISFTQGNVGIATDSPTQKLDVNGAIRVRGGIYDNNNVVGTAASVLTSTGSGVHWAAPVQGTTGAQGTQGIQGVQGTSFVRDEYNYTATAGQTTFNATYADGTLPIMMILRFLLLSIRKYSIKSCLNLSRTASDSSALPKSFPF